MRSINRPSCITTRYIHPADLDMSKVALPSYISWERTSSGIKLSTHGNRIQYGVEAVKFAYPLCRCYPTKEAGFLDDESPLKLAQRRIDATPELEQYRDLIFYDWPEGDIHLLWIHGADTQAIIDWAETIRALTLDEALQDFTSIPIVDSDYQVE